MQTTVEEEEVVLQGVDHRTEEVVVIDVVLVIAEEVVVVIVVLLDMVVVVNHDRIQGGIMSMKAVEGEGDTAEEIVVVHPTPTVEAVEAVGEDMDVDHPHVTNVDSTVICVPINVSNVNYLKRKFNKLLGLILMHMIISR